MKKITLFILIFLCLNFSYSQEINAKVIVNSESINQTNSSVFKNLEISLSNFINNSSWSNVNYSEFEKVNLSILLSITSYSNNSYVANIEFQASRPVFNSSYSTPIFNYIEKNFQFDYLEFEPIIYRDNQFDSKISSLFAFYINIIVGIDHDSFVINSGNYFYDISKKILNYANQSNVLGWNSSHNGGKFNGYTDFETTGFFYKIHTDRFANAFEIFSRFFIDPLLSEEYVVKEVNSVNSEFERNIQLDSKRKEMIFG